MTAAASAIAQRAESCRPKRGKPLVNFRSSLRARHISIDQIGPRLRAPDAEWHRNKIAAAAYAALVMARQPPLQRAEPGAPGTVRIQRAERRLWPARKQTW